MTSYRLKNTTAPKSVKQLVSEVVKNSDTTIIPRSTSFTIDSSDSSSPLDDLIENSPKKVRDLTENILRAAAKKNYLQAPASKSTRSPESSAPSMKQADENVTSLDKSTQLDPVRESNPTTRFSLDEIKAMVLQSIPDNVGTNIPTEKWNTILDEAIETTLSNDIMSLHNDPTEEDIKDLVSFLSIYVQRETRSNPPPPPASSSKKSKERKSKTSAQMLDAMTLILESLSNTAIVENKDGKLVIAKDANDLHTTDADRRVIPPMPAMPTAVPAPETLQPPAQPHSSPSGSITNKIPGYIPKPPTDRRIGFSRVQIRYYEQILSDNPSVTTGPPIGIGWKYRVMKQDLSVDAWEYKQQPCRRYLSGLLTTRENRMTWLCHLGYTQREIAAAVREVLRVKNNRIQSLNNVKLERMEEAMEQTTRRLKNVLTLGLASRQEKKLLGPYIKKKK